MATVIPDIIETLEVEESDGALKSLHRVFHISGLSGAARCAEALANGSIPVYGSVLAAYPGLVLTGRRARIMPNSPSKVRIDLEYQRYGDAQDHFVFEGSTSLRQITRETIPPFNDQITVSHTYPDDDLNYPGQTLTQGGSINVMETEGSLRATGIMACDHPIYVAGAWHKHLNLHFWGGGGTGTWMCTNVSYVPHDTGATPPKYRFTFEFSFNSDGWQPKVVFTDSTTGKPPPDLVAGVGYKEFFYYKYINFHSLFPI